MDIASNKLFRMKSDSSTRTCFEHSLELTARIELVIAAHKKLGFINRKLLMEFYNITQQQAGGLMRDFIHANARNIEWDIAGAHYKMKN